MKTQIFTPSVALWTAAQKRKPRCQCLRTDPYFRSYFRLWLI